MIGRTRLLAAAAALLACGTLVLPAGAATGVGDDISYPQCNGAFPAGQAFGIVGVNGGRVFLANPCLGTGDGPSELSWAGPNAGLYANTGDPGPALSSRWPNGQTSPKECNTTNNPGSDTPECHYDYGWNAAADSRQDAANAYAQLGWTQPANEWWLDVETANSWTSTPALNVQALQGEVDYLSSAGGATSVGFYSAPSMWQTITGSTTAFATHPTWLAGATSLADAQSRCGTTGFTGGAIVLVQFVGGGFDNDVRCGTQQPALAFATGPQSLVAGSPSATISLQLAPAAPAALAVTVSSSSASGVFSASASGPWSPSISLPVAAGGTATGSFFYEDTHAGSATLTGSAPGYANAIQTETVAAAGAAKVAVSPSDVTLRLGGRTTLQASGTDAYGNPVAVGPVWSVSPDLGTFSPTTGSQTTFTARTGGSGTITATVGSVSGGATLTVRPKKH